MMNQHHSVTIMNLWKKNSVLQSKHAWIVNHHLVGIDCLEQKCLQSDVDIPLLPLWILNYCGQSNIENSWV